MKQRSRFLLAGLFCAAFLATTSCDDDPVGPTPNTLNVTPDSIYFSGTATQPVQRQLLFVTTSGADLPYTTTASNSRLSVINGASTTPDTIFLQFTASGQPDGLYVDSLTIEAANTENSPVIIPVVTALAPFMSADADSLSFIARLGDASTDTQSVAITSASDSTIPVTAQSNQSWLRVDLAADTLPTELHLWATPGALVPGTYSATATVTSATAGNAVSVHVTLEILQWFTQVSPVNATLRDVFFLDRNRGWIAGILPSTGINDGVILVTTDGGATWNLDQTFFDQAIGAIRVFPNDTGWISGTNATVRRTVNGGTSWSNVTTPFTAADDIDYQDLFFISADTGWVVGDSGVIIYTDNAGDSWTTQTAGLVNQQLAGVTAVGSRHAWAVGNGNSILATTDGGTLWLKQSAPAGAATIDWGDVAFIDTLNGFVVGELGQLLSTVDGGATWQPAEVFNLSDSTNLTLDRITFVTSTLGFIVGGENYLGQPVSSVVLRTTDGGQTWEFLQTGTTRALRSIYFVDPDFGWAVGNNGLILHTQVGSN